MSYAPAVNVHRRTPLLSVLLALTLILVAAPTGATPAEAAPTAITTWREPGSLPLPDAEAANQVASRPENRWDNKSANHYSPSDEELEAFRNGQRDQYGRTAVKYNPLAQYVTGGFTGTTDEILQWAAQKWGIPEDVVRAVAVGESWWRMSQLGDPHGGVDASAYPEQSRIDDDSVYQSLGIMQIKWTTEGLHRGTEPLRWKSTAFNVDYWAATVRYYFDGYCDWCGPDYAAGEEWESVAAWCSPSPWKGEDMDAYIRYAKHNFWDRAWESRWFG